MATRLAPEMAMQDRLGALIDEDHEGLRRLVVQQKLIDPSGLAAALAALGAGWAWDTEEEED